MNARSCLHNLVAGLALAAAVTGSAQAAEASAPSQGAVAAILQSANEGEVMAAEVALERAVNPLVRAYAEMMRADHTFANLALWQLGITPDWSDPTATELQGHAATQASLLRSLEGEAFDRAYVAGQVHDHALVLDLLDGLLGVEEGGTAPAPGADGLSPAQAKLATMRGAVQVHLAIAEQLAEELGVTHDLRVTP